MIRLLLVDEIRLMCHIMAAVLNEEEDLEVTGMATTVSEAIDQLDRCDVALVSIGLPDHGALKITRQATSRDKPVKVIIVGLSESQGLILEYIEQGAAGYVLRDDSIEELLKNLRAVHRNRAIVSPDIAAALMTRVAQLSDRFTSAGVDLKRIDLTPRELEVLTLIGRGFTNQEIAEDLYIEVGTVKNHVHNVLSKLNVSSREEAATYLALMENAPRNDLE